MQRVIALEGASNFRDLGGYAASGGRSLRWRRVFRSDHLGKLTARDHDVMTALGITRSFDFRGAHESTLKPYEVRGVVRHALSIEPGTAQRMDELAAAGLPLTVENVVALMCELYRSLINEQHQRFAEFFEHLRADASPLVFHCTAGKDRTGVATALLLLALGASEAVVEQDYLLTNDVYRRPVYRAGRSSIPEDAFALLWGVQPAYLHAALRAIDEDQGGLEHYLTNRLGLAPIAREQLAERLLESVSGLA